MLDLARRDRDLIAEIRNNSMDIYCKGQRLISIDPRAGDAYQFIGTEKFWPGKSKNFRDIEAVNNFCQKCVPMIKQRIAEHQPKGREIEFEQMLIRSNNLEGINGDYVAIDRQRVTKNREGQTDIVGVFWPDHLRSPTLAPAIIEVKYKLNGGIEGIAGQIEDYFKDLSNSLPTFANDLKEQLRQKARLGLIAGLSKSALEKIQRLPISPLIDDVRIVVALVDYNPKSTRLDLKNLRKLPFHKQIDLFYLGFGMLQRNSVFRS
jgi:hypothetical protein